MTERLTITERLKTILQKTIEAKYERIITESSKKLKKGIKIIQRGCEDDEYGVIRNTNRINDKIELIVLVSSTQHEEWCNKYNHIDEDDVYDADDKNENIIEDGMHCDMCNRVSGLSMLVILNYLGTTLKRFRFHTHYWGGKIVRYTWDYLFKKLMKDLKEQYSFCQCGSLCFIKDGEIQNMCEDCYINSYIRTEEEGGECCVCMQNDGCWAKLDNCNHILHSHCLKKIRETCITCPMCRSVPRNIIQNPYNY